MTTATAALDPGETIAAAMRELYDQLREIVDRGPTDDPGLLDEIGRLTGRIRRRITSARKKAEPAEEPTTSQPAPPATAPELTRVREIRTQMATASPQTVGTVAVDPPTVPRHRAVTVTLPARRSGEATIRLHRPATGRHRAATPRLPLWVRMLVILLIVGGIALGTTSSTWAFGMAPAGAAVLGAARWWSVHRQVMTPGGRR